MIGTRMRRVARLASIAGMSLACLVASACRDDSSPRDGGAAGNDAALTEPADGQAASVRGQRALETRNQHAWVGPAHNRALDDFRSALRKPGVLTDHMCEFVVNFAMMPERVPSAHRVAGAETWQAARAVADSSARCGAARKTRLSNISRRSPVGILGPAPVIQASPDASAILDEIDAAIWNAADAQDLANRLNVLLGRSYALAPAEQELIGATISVAQSSYEYWSQHYPAFEQEVIAEYSPCVEQYSAYGETDVLDSCIYGKGTGGAVVLGAPGAALRRQLVARKPATLCGPGLKEGFKKIGSADARGAFVGGMGAIFGGASIVLGALAGAATGSTYAAIENAVSTLICIYAK